MTDPPRLPPQNPGEETRAKRVAEAARAARENCEG